jgi:hypothetical protein
MISHGGIKYLKRHRFTVTESQMVLLSFLSLLATMLVAPDTQIGRFLHHIMVERPAAALSRVTFGHILLTSTLLLAVVITLWLMQNEGLRLLASFAPDTITWIVAFDVSTYLEAVSALALIASAVRFRAIRVQLRNILPRRVARTGRRESRSPPPLKADNDNEEDSRRQAA